MADRNSNMRSGGGGTVAVIGGGALLLWLLLRGKGWGWGGGSGKGSGEGSGGGTSGAGTASAVTEAPAPVRPVCQVFVRAQRIDLDGVPADLPTIVARCRASGRADVRATGGASVKSVEDVVGALQAAGVTVTASDSVWTTIQREGVWAASHREIARKP